MDDETVGEEFKRLRARPPRTQARREAVERRRLALLEEECARDEERLLCDRVEVAVGGAGR